MRRLLPVETTLPTLAGISHEHFQLAPRSPLFRIHCWQAPGAHVFPRSPSFWLCSLMEREARVQKGTVEPSVERPTAEQPVMINRLSSAGRLAKSGAWVEISSVVRTYWRSDAEAVGLRRDVTIPFVPPQAAIPITVRPLRESDIPFLFEGAGEQLSGEAIRQRAMGLRMVRANLPTCYVAANEDDQPCYVQWLIAASDGENVRSLFGDRFPALKPDEMLLEGAFTLEAWRGQGIMAAAMAQIAAKAAEHGARWVITMVFTSNIPSLKGCKKAGFAPYLCRTDRWRCFKRRSVFSPLSSPTI